jgi:predicted acyltransferase
MKMDATGLTPPAAGSSREKSQRFVALDVMRGFVMLALSWGLLGRDAVNRQPALTWLARQFYHVTWEGMVFWDLIQPIFWFVVGAALPFAMASRLKRGETRGAMLRHALWRALKLAVIGQILLAIQVSKLHFHTRETLTQLAVCYLLCVLIVQLPLRGQALAAAGLMALNWGLYLAFPGATGPFSPADNVGVRIDSALFGLNSAGRWVTIYFIGSTVTMLAGAWTGAFLSSGRTPRQKLRLLAAAAAACLAAGLALRPVSPLMQKLWTASYTFWTAGLVLLSLAGLFWILDIRGWRKPFFPLVVVGMNGIFFYALSQALGTWVDQSLAVFSGRFAFVGVVAAVVQTTAAVGIMWYVAFWLYRRKIFFKL